jgi:protease-4
MEHTETLRKTENTSQLPRVEKKKSRGIWWFLLFIVFICGIVSCCALLIFALPESTGSNTGVVTSESFVYGDQNSKNKILSIKVDGPILTEGSSSGFASLLSVGYVYGYSIKEELYRAAEDDTIKAVVLEINSPGGTVVGSKAISDGVAYYKNKTKKPVFAYIQDMAASGGYWAAASTDKIYAETGSLTGSIGVIFGPFEYYDELVSLGSVNTRNGIDIYYITGGTYKDLGNPVRKITREEYQSLQQQIDNEYDVFVRHVSRNRSIPENVIRQDIKALIYGNEDARRFKLIDAEGNREDTYAALASTAKLSDYKVVRKENRIDFFSALLASRSNVKTSTVSKSCALCGKMLYLHGDPMEFQLVKEE